MEQAIAPQIGANGGYLSYNDCVTIRIIIYLDTARRTGKGSVSVSEIVQDEVGLLEKVVRGRLEALVQSKVVTSEKASGSIDTDVYRLREGVRIADLSLRS